MSSYRQILLAEWLNTHQNNSGFLMRSPRMNKHLSVLVDALVREPRLFRRVYLFEDATSQPKDS